MNKIISQKTLIQVLSLLVGLLSALLQLLSLDKLNSLPYFLIGISLSVGGIFFAKKIKIFSPIFNFCNCIFFAYVFSGLYYFCAKEDVMGSLTLLHCPVFYGINFVYLIFFLSLFVPISLYLCYQNRIKCPKFKVLELKLHTQSYNIKLWVFNILFFILFLISLKFTGMGLKDAFLNSGQFRRLVSNGNVAMMYILFLTAFSFIYSLVIKDIVLKTHKFSFINKSILIILFIVWALICGSKSVLIFTGIFPFIFVYVLYKPLKVKHVFFAIVGIIVVLLYCSFLNIFRGSGAVMASMNDYSELSNISVFSTLANRNDNFANSIKFFTYMDNRHASFIYYDDFHYKKEITNHFIKFLPKTIRGAITSSNCDFFGTEMSKIIYPDAVANQRATFEFGTVCNLYYCFGIAGVFSGGILISLLIILLDVLFYKYIYSDIFLTLFLSIIYSLHTSILAVGVINVAPTMKLFYTIPMFIVLVWIFMKNTNIKVKLR